MIMLNLMVGFSIKIMVSLLLRIGSVKYLLEMKMGNMYQK